MKTVYVIGAGASCDVGLPVGDQLKVEISKLLYIKYGSSNSPDYGDPEIYDVLKHLNRNDSTFEKYAQNEILPLCWNISENLPLAISIDNYIDNHSDKKEVEIIGKLAILRAISIAERKSQLYLKRNVEFSSRNLLKTWYIKFFQSVTENCKFKDVGKVFKQITLIIFNYDRCIEHFLFHSLKSYYGRSDSEVEALLGQLTIIHPYGKLGELSHLSPHAGIKYGHDFSSGELLENLSNIKTFTEGMSNDSKSQDHIREAMYEAERLVFLGFAFHELNMKLLTPSHSQHRPVQCFASTFGISENDKSIVEEMIKNIYGYSQGKEEVKILSADMKCFEFFNHFRLSLRYT